MKTQLIRFRLGDFGHIRKTLLADLSKESFAVALGKRLDVDGLTVISVREIRFPDAQDYAARSLMHVKPSKKYIHRILAEVVSRHDVDTLVDIHNHPLDSDQVHFSSVDDRDEQNFYRFLVQHFENVHFASIVLSQERYRARIWETGVESPESWRALVKTPSVFETIPEADEPWESIHTEPDEMQSRTVSALGLDYWRRITRNQKIILAGVGGVGSVMAEDVVHNGISQIGLIDPDHLELSNQNRFVGGTYQDAVEKRAKVDVVERHLKGINPNIRIETSKTEVNHPQARRMMAEADWILLSTDNHTSRFDCMRTALEFNVPLISAGVNITVKDGKLIDMSGEIITIRPGDNYCLMCLGRINYAKLAVESHPDEAVRVGTVQRGYVRGMNIEEPAVKNLNSIVGTLAVEALLDQYLKPIGHVPILVYENNGNRCIYPDRESFNDHVTGCSHCSLE